jgi:hypothetical protein
MTEQKIDILDMLVEALALRIKDKLMEEITETINKNLPTVNADGVEGLEHMIDCHIEATFNDRNNRIDVDQVEGIDNVIEKIFSNGDIKISADDIDGLEDFIKETVKQATVSFDFS